MKTQIWSAFLASTVLAGLATHGLAAHAGFQRRLNAMSCMTDPQGSQSDWEIVNGERRWHGSGSGRIYCPLVHDDSVPVRSINFLYVEGYNTNNNSGIAGPAAKLCVTYWGSEGGECGTAIGKDNAAPYGIVGGLFYIFLNPLEHLPYTNYQDYPYVFLLLAPEQSNGPSSVRGLYWGN